MNPNCNRNCIQGHFCDCDDAVYQSSKTERLTVWTIVVVTACIVAALVVSPYQDLAVIDAAYVRNVLGLIVDAIDAGFAQLLRAVT